MTRVSSTYVPCCSEMCIGKVIEHERSTIAKSCNFSDPFQINTKSVINKIHQRTQQPYLHLSFSDKTDAIVQYLRASCFKGLTQKGYVSISLKVIPDGPEVCRKAFQYFFGITENNYFSMCNMLKLGIVNSQRALGDTSRVSGGSSSHSSSNNRIIPVTNVFGDRFNVDVTARDIGLMNLPNTPRAHQLFKWLDDLFDIIGDYMPNIQEIHLDSITVKKQLWDMYCEELKLICKEPLKYTTFLEIMNSCFPHVKIREYKGVTGKCLTCTMLTDLRQTHRDQRTIKLATDLFAFHRAGFMGERQAFYSRKDQAEEYPEDFASIITDGMAKTNTQLPSLGK